MRGLGFYYDIKGIQRYKEGKAGADEIGVEALDERTVRIYGEKRCDSASSGDDGVYGGSSRAAPPRRSESRTLGGHGGRFRLVGSDAAFELGT